MKFPTEQSLEAFHREGGGAFEAVVIRPLNILGLIAEARGGSAKAARLLLAVGQWRKGAGKARPLCLRRGCATEFSAQVAPAAFVIILPFRDDVRNCLSCGVCARCAVASDDDLLLLLRQFWSDMKILDLPHDAGRA
jgi:hypothetical protein